MLPGHCNVRRLDLFHKGTTGLGFLLGIVSQILVAVDGDNNKQKYHNWVWNVDAKNALGETNKNTCGGNLHLPI